MKANIELHVHPFLERNSLQDIVRTMHQRRLDVVAMEALDASIYHIVRELLKLAYPDSVSDDKGTRLPCGKYLLNAKEYNTKEGLHLLTIGYSMDSSTPDTEIRKIIDDALLNQALVIMDHPFVDNERTKTAGHISEELEQEVVKICKEYPGEIALEWNGYCNNLLRWGLKHVLNVKGIETRYHNVNRKVEELSDSLKSQGYNVPLIADTDVHARKRRHLKYMGTSRIICDVNGEMPEEIVASIRRNIFAGDYENVRKTVNPLHLIDAFGLPILFSKYFKKPRG